MGGPCSGCGWPVAPGGVRSREKERALTAEARCECVHLVFPLQKGFTYEKDCLSHSVLPSHNPGRCITCPRPRTGCTCARPTLSNDPVFGCQIFRRLQPLRFGEIRIVFGRRFGVLP